MQRTLASLTLSAALLAAPGAATTTASAADPGPHAATSTATSTATSAKPLVHRVEDTALVRSPYRYSRKTWRITRARDLPRWLTVRRGQLRGTPPRRGTWRIVLSEERTKGRPGGPRHTIVKLRALRPRAERGTVLVTRGHDGRPANGDSLDPVMSGDGGTVVFNSIATNLVRGTHTSTPPTSGPSGRAVYAWDSATRRTTMVTDRWSWILGLSHDGDQLLLSDTKLELTLHDLDTGSQVTVAASAQEAALTADGDRVIYQEGISTLTSEVARIMEWDRTTGQARAVHTLPKTMSFTGAISGDGRYALLAQTYWAAPDQPAALLDLTTGEVRDVPGLNLRSWHVDSSAISTDGRRVALLGSGCVIPDPPPDCGFATGLVLDLDSGQLLDGAAQQNLGADLTPDGRWFSVSTAEAHLTLVDSATGRRYRPFRSAPSGTEYGASISEDGGRVTYVSTGHDLLRHTRRGVHNLYVWSRP